MVFAGSIMVIDTEIGIIKTNSITFLSFLTLFHINSSLKDKNPSLIPKLWVK